MIERYVYLKFKDEHANDASRREAAQACRELIAQVPGVLSVTAGIPADADCESKWDLSLVVRFANLADVEPYRVHPTHQKLIDDVLGPRKLVVKAWNFDVGD